MSLERLFEDLLSNLCLGPEKYVEGYLRHIVWRYSCTEVKDVHQGRDLEEQNGNEKEHDNRNINTDRWQLRFHSLLTKDEEMTNILI